MGGHYQTVERIDETNFQFYNANYVATLEQYYTTFEDFCLIGLIAVA
jgi:hypothetical protein